MALITALVRNDPRPMLILQNFDSDPATHGAVTGVAWANLFARGAKSTSAILHDSAQATVRMTHTFYVRAN